MRPSTLIGALLVLGCTNPLLDHARDIATGSTAELKSLSVTAGDEPVALGPSFLQDVLEYRAVVHRSVATVVVSASPVVNPTCPFSCQ